MVRIFIKKCWHIILETEKPFGIGIRNVLSPRKEFHLIQEMMPFMKATISKVAVNRKSKTQKEKNLKIEPTLIKQSYASPLLQQKNTNLYKNHYVKILSNLKSNQSTHTYKTQTAGSWYWFSSTLILKFC